MNASATKFPESISATFNVPSCSFTQTANFPSLVILALYFALHSMSSYFVWKFCKIDPEYMSNTLSVLSIALWPSQLKWIRCVGFMLLVLTVWLLLTSMMTVLCKSPSNASLSDASVLIAKMFVEFGMANSTSFRKLPTL